MAQATVAPVHPRLSSTNTNRPARHAASYLAGSLAAPPRLVFLPLHDRVV
jgi:hypothetical protein